jgi:hypothetical protein
VIFKKFSKFRPRMVWRERSGEIRAGMAIEVKKEMKMRNFL